MAASAWAVHDKAKQKFLNGGGLDLDTDALVLRLYTAASNIQTTSVSDATTATNELGTANGYTAGGQVITTPTVSEAAGVTTFDCDNAVWTAAGGSITARLAAIVDTTATPDEVICSCSLDASDVIATDTNTLTVAMNASGVFTVS